MKTGKRVDKRLIRPERLRRVPEQFSWIDQALVQRHLIDRCDARSAALYLFLVTVADAQGLSYYGSCTLAQRLKLSAEELAAARARLIELELIAYAAPLYQVLALPAASSSSPPPPSSSSPWSGPSTDPVDIGPRCSAGPVSLGELLAQLERRRRDRL
jgi:hypothetical protein